MKRDQGKGPMVRSKCILTLTEPKQNNYMRLIYCNEYKQMKELPFQIIDCAKTKSINNFYADMYYLEDLPEFRNAENLTSISGLCRNCKSLKYVEGLFNSAQVEDFSEAFLGCASIDEFPEAFDFSSAKNYKDMFKGCTKLEKVVLKNVPENFDISLLGAPESCEIVIE